MDLQKMCILKNTVRDQNRNRRERGLRAFVEICFGLTTDTFSAVPLHIIYDDLDIIWNSTAKNYTYSGEKPVWNSEKRDEYLKVMRLMGHVFDQKTELNTVTTIISNEINEPEKK